MESGDTKRVPALFISCTRITENFLPGSRVSQTFQTDQIFQVAMPFWKGEKCVYCNWWRASQRNSDWVGLEIGWIRLQKYQHPSKPQKIAVVKLAEISRRCRIQSWCRRKVEEKVQNLHGRYMVTPDPRISENPKTSSWHRVYFQPNQNILARYREHRILWRRFSKYSVAEYPSGQSKWPHFDRYINNWFGSIGSSAKHRSRQPQITRKNRQW